MPYANGKICYIEIPTRDVARSVALIVQPMRPGAPEMAALFADPDGNVLGLYQEPKNR